MKFARIVNYQAVDVRSESPEGFFHPDIAAQFVEVPDDVQDGWTLDDGVWSAPAVADPVLEPTPTPAPEAKKVSPVEFKLLFSAPERVAIKAARASDPILEDFYEIVEDPRLTHVDLGLASTQAAIGYLQSKGLLTAERAAQVLAGDIV